MQTRRLVGAGAALVGVLLAGLATIQPAQADPAPVRAAADQPAAKGTPMRDYWDFRYAGVRIFDRPDASGAVRGLGYPGQATTYHTNVKGPWYQCEEFESDAWFDVTNDATGVRGWVPMCNLRAVSD